MLHNTNISSFLSAANGQDPLLRCYCGLIALELVIKHEIGLADHNVINGLNKLRLAKAVNAKAWASVPLIALMNKLRTDLVAVYVNGRDGLPRTIPAEIYPYIRYCRFANDGWNWPYITNVELITLGNTVQQIRTFLRTNFSLPT